MTSVNNYKRLPWTETRIMRGHRYYQVQASDYLCEFVENERMRLFASVVTWIMKFAKKGLVTCWVPASCRYVLFKIGEHTVIKLQANCITYICADHNVLGGYPEVGTWVNESGRSPRRRNLKYNLRHGFNMHIKELYAQAIDYYTALK